MGAIAEAFYHYDSASSNVSCYNFLLVKCQANTHSGERFLLCQQEIAIQCTILKNLSV